jgi:hypothetical protein
MKRKREGVYYSRTPQNSYGYQPILVTPSNPMQQSWWADVTDDLSINNNLKAHAET